MQPAGPVNALASSGNQLFVGGKFESVGDRRAANIFVAAVDAGLPIGAADPAARGVGSGPALHAQPLGDGLDGSVLALAVVPAAAAESASPRGGEYILVRSVSLPCDIL